MRRPRPLPNLTPKISFTNPGNCGPPVRSFTSTITMFPKCISTRPWLFVAVAFIGFVAWWMFLITLAVKNAPPEIPLVTRAVHAVH